MGDDGFELAVSFARIGDSEGSLYDDDLLHLERVVKRFRGVVQ